MTDLGDVGGWEDLREGEEWWMGGCLEDKCGKGSTLHALRLLDETINDLCLLLLHLHGSRNQAPLPFPRRIPLLSASSWGIETATSDPLRSWPTSASESEQRRWKRVLEVRGVLVYRWDQTGFSFIPLEYIYLCTPVFFLFFYFLIWNHEH